MLDLVLEHAEFLAQQFEGAVARSVILGQSRLQGVLLQAGHHPFAVDRKGLSGCLSGRSLHFCGRGLDLSDARLNALVLR